jgi:hypothetical protein
MSAEIEKVCRTEFPLFKFPVSIISGNAGSDFVTATIDLRDALIAYYKQFEPILRNKLYIIFSLAIGYLPEYRMRSLNEYDKGVKVIEGMSCRLTDDIDFIEHINFLPYMIKDSQPLYSSHSFSAINKVISVLLKATLQNFKRVEFCEWISKVWILRAVVDALKD